MPDSVGLRALKETAQLSATAAGASGASLSGKTFAWSSSDPSTASVDASGRVTAEANGTAWIRAAAEGHADSASVVVKQVAASVAIDPVGLTVAVGSVQTLSASVLDENGHTLSEALVEWASLAPDVASVGESGAVTGLAPGSARVVATFVDAEAGVEVSDTVEVDVGHVLVSSVTPTPLAPGATATLLGAYFHPEPDENTVDVGGVEVTVISASPSELEVELPGRRTFPCMPDGGARMRVTVGSSTGALETPLEVSLKRRLSAGEHLLVLDPEKVRCNELDDGAGTYLISVMSTNPDVDADASAFRLRGQAASAVTTALRPHIGGAPPTRVAVSGDRRAPQDPSVLGLERYGTEIVLELPERLRGLTPARGLSFPAAAEPVSVSVGDRVTRRIPDAAQHDACEAFTEVTARVAYMGTHGLVLEDVMAPLAGVMDVDFQALVDELDTSMMPMVREYMGDPLAMNEGLEAGSRFEILVSPVINDVGSLVALQFAGDLLPRADCPSSDERAIFYAHVPTLPETDDFFRFRTRANWLWTIRPNVVHNLARSASYAERYARGAPQEERWLRDAAAFIAEEIYVRAYFGKPARANLGYDDTLWCELRPHMSPCAGSPRVMWTHFVNLRDYYRSPSSASPLVPGTRAGRGASWSFLRWAADHSGMEEAVFFRSLVQSMKGGVSNLETQAGHAFDELLGLWTLASVLDDLLDPGPIDPRLNLPSWDTRDVFERLHRDQGQVFMEPFPLEVRSAESAFDFHLTDVPAGGAFFLELTGVGPEPWLLELTGPDGEDPEEALRLAVARIR